MVRRLTALWLLIAVSLVLPAAGVPQRLCTRDLTFLAPGQDCHSCEGVTADCDCDHHGSPSRTTCIVAAKVLPDAVKFGALTLPPLFATIPASIEPPAALGTELATFNADPPAERPPPGGRELCLLKRALLL